ncbi:MAG: hypothetical protein U0838_01095 [Chloroflexota bacterium]
MHELQSTLAVMRASRSMGGIEAVRSTDPVAVGALFSSIAEQIGAARRSSTSSPRARGSPFCRCDRGAAMRDKVAAIAVQTGSMRAA